MKKLEIQEKSKKKFFFDEKIGNPRKIKKKILS